MLTSPSLLFCDEPTTGLDSFMAQSVWPSADLTWHDMTCFSVLDVDLTYFSVLDVDLAISPVLWWAYHWIRLLHGSERGGGASSSHHQRVHYTVHNTPAFVSGLRPVWPVSVIYIIHAFFNPFKPEFTIVISSATSRELLSQFSTCSEWRWFDVV